MYTGQALRQRYAFSLGAWQICPRLAGFFVQRLGQLSSVANVADARLGFEESF